VSAAAKVLERARAADVRLEARGRRLAYDAPANVSPDLLAQLRQCKVELLELLQHERRQLLDLASDPKTKARCLSSLIGTLSPSRAPHRWPAATWPQFIVDAQTFCRDWAERAFLSGWAAWELFGCHRCAPWKRIQGMGLVLLLRGREIVALTATEAVIWTSTGARQTAGSLPTRSILLNAVSSGSLKMNAEQLLGHAGGLVNRRRAEYGQPGDLFESIRGTSTALPTSRATRAAWRRCCPMRELRSRWRDS
jgi:TubC N-terminal docking domain